MRDYTFGDFLKELRMKKGLTQYGLGRILGVSDKAVSKWENGTAKPQSGILFRLCEVLEVSVDELLSCKVSEGEANEGLERSSMKKELWNRAYEKMHELYGDNIPAECLNRFYTEKMLLEESDSLMIWDVLSRLWTEAKRQGECFVIGGNGSSYTAYLLGATDINPIAPHYYCPHCRSVVFDHSAEDGWDLSRKKCSCGRSYERDGHRIPVESLRRVSFVRMAPSFLPNAAEMVKSYFEERNIPTEEHKDDEGRMKSFALVSNAVKSALMFLCYPEFEKYRTLQENTATSFGRIDFTEDAVLRRFQAADTDGIRELCGEFAKQVLRFASPESYDELIRLTGLTHSSGVWVGNAEDLLREGMSVGKVLSCCDDVFRYVSERMAAVGCCETGFARRVMDSTRSGIYAKNGIPAEERKVLERIGAEEWFFDSVCKIRYMFQRTDCVEHAAMGMKLMWYKIHYPAEFAETLADDM